MAEAMLPYPTEHFGNPSSNHAHGRTAQTAVTAARSAIADLLDTTPEEIVFTGSGSEADTLTIRGAALVLRRPRSTKRVDSTNGVLAGRSYKSPSGAAIGIVQALNPSVHPNRNGWSFWFLRDNGKSLQSIRDG